MPRIQFSEELNSSIQHLLIRFSLLQIFLNLFSRYGLERIDQEFTEARNYFIDRVNKK